jgi:hypothetical protein
MKRKFKGRGSGRKTPGDVMREIAREFKKKKKNSNG